MNREDIIRMALKAGFGFNGGSSPAIERLANLIAEAEREACAKVCEEGWKDGIGAQYQGDVFAAAIRARGEK